jgi:predicted Rdx family selenoprotein
MEAETLALTPDQGLMEILDHTGDTKLIWDRKKNAEVEAARTMFDSLRAKRYLAFQAEGDDGRKGKQIERFDPDMERLILVPPMVGG